MQAAGRTFAFVVLFLFAGSARGQVAYEWVTQAGPNNVVDSNARSCDPFEGCFDNTGEQCALALDRICDLQTVPAGRCTYGDAAAGCVWPSGAGRCASDVHVGCVSDAYRANPANTGSGPSAMCPSGGICDMTTDPFGGAFRANCRCQGQNPADGATFETAVCGAAGICSDGDPLRARGGYGIASGAEFVGEVLVDFPKLGPSVNGSATPSTSPRYPIENLPLTVDAQRTPGSVGTPFLQGRILQTRTTDARQNTGSTLYDKLLGFGNSYWADWSVTLPPNSRVSETSALLPCPATPGWSPDQKIDPTPGAPNSGDERYCSQLGRNSLTFAWHRDLTIGERVANPFCPPTCKKDFDLHSGEL